MIQSLHQRAKSLIAFAKSRQRLAGAYQQVYESPDGRLVINDILRKGGLLETSHVKEDPGTSAFMEGRRALALDVVQALRWSEGELVTLARQQTAEQLDEGDA